MSRDFLQLEVQIKGKPQFDLADRYRILDFVDGAMDNWRLLGSDPSEAKGIVQVSIPLFTSFDRRCYIEPRQKPFNLLE